MKTQVEIYEVEDVRAETPEQSAEALALISELGLEGQKQAAAETSGVQVRFPYRLMTDEELFVYKTLCPQTNSLQAFSDSPIPLEVLKTAAFAKSLRDPRIGYLEVWSATSVKVKDPVLVAKDSQYSSSKFYILARWGEELLPLDVLLPDALKKWWASRLDRLNEIKAQIETEVRKPCPQSAQRVSEPYFSM